MAEDKNDFLNPDAQVSMGEETEADGMVIDLDEVDESAPTFEAMPPGVYDCVVDNTDFGMSQRSGNPMITWVFRVVDPQYENRLLFYHTTLHDKRGQGQFKRTLARVVPDAAKGKLIPKQFAEEGTAVGMPCRVKVNVRPYEGQKRNNVKEVLPPADAGSFLDE